MAFDHGKFITLITDYYEFFSRGFWGTPVHYVPPSMSNDIMARVKKNDKPAKLIRHLPYPKHDTRPGYTAALPHIMESTFFTNY
ncbi:hypothetical protein NOF04DRAFT_1197196 [Fusarium oxysporum II5]|nr:hypothetical protein NOF04DRAFT_1197196 [Fusarium oxysporum II5]